jgi:ferritin
MSVLLDSRMADALQVQMNREMVAALVYKQMRCDFRLQEWYGFHKFMHKSEKEELGHARDFDHYLTERNVRPVYNNIQIPPILFSTVPLDYFNAALKLEELYWRYMEELYQLSEDCEDPDTCNFLYEKVEQQHESVAELNNIIKKLQRAGTDMAALQDLDKRILDIVEEK